MHKKGHAFSSKAYHNNEVVKIFDFKKVYLRVHTMISLLLTDLAKFVSFLFLHKTILINNI